MPDDEIEDRVAWVPPVEEPLRMLPAWVGPSEQTMMREIYDARGLAYPDHPIVPTEEVTRRRARFLVEECFEILEAQFSDSPTMRMLLPRLKAELYEAIDSAHVRVDLVGVVDGLTDLKYIIGGSELEYGIDGPPVFRLVHLANIAKAAGGTDEKGKWVKPAGWQPPDVHSELLRQGWDPSRGG